MRRLGEIAGRLGMSALHVLLNTFLIMVTGKYFGSAWENLGRRSTLESGEALLFVALLVAVPTIIFWQVPVRRRPAGAAVLTACAIAASGVGSYFLGSYRAG
jgi:hypothetical protein